MSTTSSGGPQVSVTIDEPTALAGGALDAQVTVSGELDEKVRGLRVELLYVNEYQYKEQRQYGTDSGYGTSESYDPARTQTVTVTGTDEVVVQTLSFPLSPGPAPGSHRAQLWVPEQAPPTAGQLVRWKVRAVVDRARGQDVTADARVVVQSSREAGAARASAPPSVDEQLDIALSDRSVRPGDTVSGTLVVKPDKRVKFTDIRVEIQMHRRDQDGISKDETVAGVTVSGKTEVEGGARQEYPFELPVPVDLMPSFTASKNEIHYEFVASGARRLKTDYNATAAIFVSSEGT